MPSGIQRSELAKLRGFVAGDRDMQTLLVATLQDMGIHEVARAADSKAAIAYLHRRGRLTDFVICDGDLPDAGGLEVLKFVRKFHRSKPFLMLSANVSRESIAAAQAHGVTGFLAIPFNARALQQRVVAMAKALPRGAAPSEKVEDADPDDDAWMI